MSELKDLIRSRREALNMTQVELGRLIGSKQSTVSDIESGANKRQNSMIAAAKALGISDDEIREAILADGGSVPAIKKDDASPSKGRGHQVFRNLTPHGEMPVLGRAAAGSPDRLVLSSEPIEFVSRPESLSEISDAYSLYVAGESMIPRYYPRERININPSRPPRRDDYVAVQVRDASGEIGVWVKQYVGIRDGSVILKQHNPPEELAFDQEDVLAIHLVVGMELD